MNSQAYLALFFMILYSSYGRSDYSFYICNKCNQTAQDGSLVSPFQNISQSFANITNSSSATVKYNLFPTSDPYQLSLDGHNLFSVDFETFYLNCSTLECSPKASVYFDFAITTQSNFSLVLNSLEIVDGSAMPQSLSIKAGLLNFNMSNTTINTIHEISFDFTVGVLESNLSNVQFNASNLNSEFLTINFNDNANLYIENLACSQLNYGIIYLYGKTYNSNSTFYLIGSNFTSDERKESNSIIPSIFQISKVANIFVRDIFFTYNLGNQQFFSVLSSASEIVFDGFTSRNSNFNQSLLIWINLEDADSDLDTNLTVDNFNLTSCFVVYILKLQTDANIKNVSITNVLLDNVTVVEDFKGRLNLLFNINGIQVMNHLVANWTVKDSVLYGFYIFLAPTDSELTYDYYCYITNITMNNTKLYGKSKYILSYGYGAIDLLQGYINTIIISDIRINNCTFDKIGFLISGYSMTTDKVIVTNSELHFASLFWISNDRFFPELFAGNLTNSVFSSINLSDQACIYEVEITLETAFSMSGNIFENISGLSNGILLSLSGQYVLNITMHNNQFLNLDVQSIISTNTLHSSTKIEKNTFSNIKTVYLFSSLGGQNLLELKVAKNIIIDVNTVYLYYIVEYYELIFKLSEESINNLTFATTPPYAGYLYLEVQHLFLSLHDQILNGISFPYPTFNSRCYLIYSQFGVDALTINGTVMNNFVFNKISALFAIFYTVKFNFVESQLSNIIMINPAEIPIQLSSSDANITNSTFTNIVIQQISNKAERIGQFILLDYIDNKKMPISFQNVNIEGWTSTIPFISLNSNKGDIVMNEIFCNFSSWIFDLEYLAGSMNASNIKLLNSGGTFLRFINSNTKDFAINISNYSQNSFDGSKTYAFLIESENITSSFENISLVDMPFLKIGKFTKTLAIKNITIKGQKNDDVIAIATTNDLISFPEGSHTSVKIEQILVANSGIPSFLNIEHENSQQMAVYLSKGLFQNISGDNFITIKDTYGKTRISTTNFIFESANITLYENRNSSLTFTNLIQTRSFPPKPFSDISLVNESATKILNSTLYNVFPKSQSLSDLKGKESFMLNNSIISNSLGHISTSNSNFSSLFGIFSSNYNFLSKGGCISAYDSNINLTNNSLLNNIGLIGGVLFEEISNFSSSYNTSNILINNTGYLYGPNWASQPINITLTLQNMHNLKSILAEYQNSTLQVVESGYQYTYYNLSNVSETFAINTLVSINLFDYLNQSISYDELYPISVSIIYPQSNQSNRLFISSESILPTSSYGFIANNITLPPVPQNGSIFIMVQYGSFSLQIALDIYMRNCLPGEVFDELTLSCNLCPEGYFSLNISKSCESCPYGSYCPGGRFIDVKESFWREPGTSNVFSCIDDTVMRCKGGYNTSDQCEEGYSGGLCEGCNYAGGFSPNSASVCQPCNTDMLSLIVSNAIYLLLSFAYELVMIYYNYKSNKIYVKNLQTETIKDKESEEISMVNFKISSLLNVLNNFFQLLYITWNFIFEYETSFVTLLNQIQFILAFSSAQIQSTSSFDCLLLGLGVTPDDVTYFKLVFQFVLPFVKMVLIALFLTIRSFRTKKWKNLLSKILLSAFILIQMDQTGVVFYLSKFTTCRIGNFEGYSILDPNIKCSDLQYTNFMHDFTYPGLFLWGLIFPISFAILFFSIRSKLQQENVRRIFGAFMNNYKDTKFFWNIVVLILKMGIILILTLVFEPRNATFFVCLLMSIYVVLLYKFKPLKYEESNSTNEKAAFIILASLVIFNQAVGNQGYYITVYGILIAMINLMVFVYLVQKIIVLLKIKYDLNKKHKKAIREARYEEAEESFLNKNDESDENKHL